MHLLNDGVARQKPENQTRWIELASSLMDAQLVIVNKRKSDETLFTLHQLSNENDMLESYQVRFQQAGSPYQLELKINGITEQVVTATAFFMLNELGRLPSSKRQAAFDALRAKFNYDVYRLQRDSLGLDSRQLDRLSRGESIVVLNTQYGRGLALETYAPWGGTTDVLALGPIEFFDPYPAHIAALVLATTLLLMALAVMAIIRGLARRLVDLQDKVDAIKPESLAKENKVTNTDVISELNQKIQDMAARIKRLLDEKAYMIRAVSHDLRTPISKIHFRLEVLSQKLGEDDTLLKGCQNDLKQLNLLIDELLTYEKLSTHQPLESKSVDLPALLSEQIDDIKLVHPTLTISVEDNSLDARIVKGNHVLLRRLFENLLNNAARYANQHIKVHIEKIDALLQVTIDDDGQGIDEANIPNLFEPFFRAEASRNSAFGGYGLGLAIVKQVAAQHDATITASNNADGGASFTLHIPYMRESHD